MYFLVVLLKMHTSVKSLNSGFGVVAFHGYTVVNPVVGGRGVEGARGVHQTGMGANAAFNLMNN